MFEYTIGGRKFVQQELVMGQVKLLITAIKGISLPRVLTTATLILALGDRVTDVLAIILREEGVLLKDKKMDEVREWLEEHLSMEQSIRMVDDFFDCNPIASISEAVIGLAKKVEMSMNKATPQPPLTKPSTESALPLPEEI